MELKYLLSFGVVFSLCISQSVAIYCYQCSDAGDNEHADCLYGVRSLSLQRADYERKNVTLKRLPALKDCSHYIDSRGRPLYNYCKIERIYSLGSLNAYIRDCSNGSDFSADLSVTRISKTQGYLRPDNQSTCGYSHRHLANLCVQICDTSFCNGPTAGQNILSAQKSVIVLIVTFVLMFLST